METSRTQSEITLRLERTIAASPERVFKAWTDAKALSHWFAATDEHTPHVGHVEPRVGGGFRIEMRHSGGAVHTMIGDYEEVTPPSRLVFRMRWAENDSADGTRVSVLLNPEGSGTKLVLLHEKFASQDARERHEKGWTGCLDRLVRTIQT